ncbi:MAG: TIGR00730 family Rossman fold protein [Oleispira antarctica]|nr:TIGR00730 family Rossman fold protein [Oleispira antarctica]MBQ0791291.1 TIGR00730 family Rossman fold protein [Oleispira antarctica]
MGSNPIYAETIKQLGAELAKRQITCVYGGSNTGLMKVLADSVLAEGGKVIGITVKNLHDKEIFHNGLSELHVTETMHQRKAMMAERAEGFITFAGGLGTLEEFFEVYTWKKLGFHNKPCALLDVNNYFAPMLAMLAHSEAEGFVLPTDKNLLIRSDNVDELLAKMFAHNKART